MKRHASSAVIVSVLGSFALLFAPAMVLAQSYYPDAGSGGYAGGGGFGTRLIPLVVAGAFGFLLGAFFSPALRPFRRIAFLVAALAVIAYALFGPAPAAMIVDGIAAFILFLVMFAIASASVPSLLVRLRHAGDVPPAMVPPNGPICPICKRMVSSAAKASPWVKSSRRGEKARNPSIIRVCATC